MPQSSLPAYQRFTRLDAVFLAIVLACLGVAYFGDPAHRSSAIVLIAVIPIVQLTQFGIRAVRTGRIGAANRADRPAAYWSRLLGLVLLTVFIAAGVVIALLD